MFHVNQQAKRKDSGLNPKFEVFEGEKITSAQNESNFEQKDTNNLDQQEIYNGFSAREFDRKVLTALNVSQQASRDFSRSSDQ